MIILKAKVSEKNWLYAILKNKIIDHFRKASTRLTDSLPGTATDDPYFDEAAHWKQSMHPKEWDDSDSLVTKKEFYETLRNCKNKLKKIQDMVFTMKYLEGLDSEEICKVLNLTTSNYWVLIHRAKLQLRACLEKTGS
jgi:RNA polymerase sigma-70 factor (ECF subfamily)